MLTGLGFVFSFLGILFFFDRGLIALGNVRRPPPASLRCPAPLRALQCTESLWCGKEVSALWHCAPPL